MKLTVFDSLLCACIPPQKSNGKIMLFHASTRDPQLFPLAAGRRRELLALEHKALFPMLIIQSFR
jgi:hypothetical protein